MQILAFYRCKQLFQETCYKKSNNKAWCHIRGKDLLMRRIGSIFYAGIINNDAEGGTNGNYVTKEAMITESNAQY